MDNFLILGRIPGTHIQMTFSESLLALLFVCLALYLSLSSTEPKEPTSVAAIQLSRIHSISYPIARHLEATQLPRKVAILPINIWLGRLTQHLRIVR
jgi:hypothetical protein